MKTAINQPTDEFIEVVSPQDDHASKLPVVAIVTHITICPVIQGNRAVIVQLAQWLKQAGYRPFLVNQFLNYSYIDTYQEEINTLFQRSYYIDTKKKVTPFEPKLKGDLSHPLTSRCLDWIRTHHGLHAVIAEYVHMCRTMSMLPQSVIRMVQTHDVLSRMDLTTFSKAGITVDQHRILTPDEESRLLEFADDVIAITDTEKDILQKMVPGRKVITVGYAQPVKVSTTIQVQDNISKDVLFVGSRNPFNVDGIRQFVEQAWDRILSSIPSARLVIAGQVCDPLSRAISLEKYPGVCALGEVPDLDQFYSNAAVVINPTRFGTGLKIKTIDALARGKAMVVTSNGADGVVRSGSAPFLLADDMIDFADHVVAVLGNPEMRNRLETQACDFAKKQLSLEAVYHDLGVVLAEVEQPIAPSVPPSPNSRAARFDKLTSEIQAALRSPNGFEEFEKRGVHITPVHFYQPVPALTSLPDSFFSKKSEMVGVDMRAAEQRQLVSELMDKYGSEFSAFPPSLPTDARPRRYHHSNGFFAFMDGLLLYGILRKLKPRRYFEIGTGFSTLLAAAALEQNRAENGERAGIIKTFDPYASNEVAETLPASAEVHRIPAEQLDPSIFSQLEPNDVLFIDSSHVLKLNSDVQHEFLEIVPRVQLGVWVHVHDIFLPHNYSKQWVMSLKRFWTEQYILQAFLAFNTSFEVRWGARYMNAYHKDFLMNLIPDYGQGPKGPGGSFWMQRTR